MSINKTQITSIIAGALFATSAFALPTVNIVDNYIGGADHGFGDRIGTAIFEIHDMDVTLTGSVLNVRIFTNYAGEPSDIPAAPLHMALVTVIYS